MAAAPILAYLGEESSLDDDLDGIGWLSDNAHRFDALQVYIEVSRNTFVIYVLLCILITKN